MKLEAKVFRIISEKKRVRNTMSIFDKMKSVTPSKSASVNQNKMNRVYIEIRIIERVSKQDDSSIFKHDTFNLGKNTSFLGAFTTS